MVKKLPKELLDSLLIEYKVQKRLKRELNKQYGLEFNIFEILSSGKNNHISNLPENQISNIIAEFLKPSGTHGQGVIFLKLFLEEVFKRIQTQIDKSETKNILLPALREKFLNSSKIEREYQTDEGKFIDILIWLPKLYENGDLVLAIENKPWAKEQINSESGYFQIDHYVDFLEKLKNSNKIKDFVFIYLSENREPYSIKDENKRKNLEKQGRFLVLSYTDFLISWLILCKENCKADKVKLIIEDFINWILKKFKNEGENKMSIDVLKSWLLESNDSKAKIKLLYEIYKNFPHLVKQRFKELFEKLKERLEKIKDIECIIEDENNINTICLWIYNKNWEKYEEYLKKLRIINYALQVDFKWDMNFYIWHIGLSRPEERGKLNYENYKNLELKTKLEKLVKKIREKDPEYKYQDDEWWKKGWWIIRKQVEDPELIFKVFAKEGAEEIEDKWYKEIKTFIDKLKDDLSEI